MERKLVSPHEADAGWRLSGSPWLSFQRPLLGRSRSFRSLKVGAIPRRQTSRTCAAHPGSRPRLAS